MNYNALTYSPERSETDDFTERFHPWNIERVIYSRMRKLFIHLRGDHRWYSWFSVNSNVSQTKLLYIYWFLSFWSLTPPWFNCLVKISHVFHKRKKPCMLKIRWLYGFCQENDSSFLNKSCFCIILLNHNKITNFCTTSLLQANILFTSCTMSLSNNTLVL